MKLRGGGDASDWFVMAMAHGQLGHLEEARKWYDKAVEWMSKNQSNNDELQRFRAVATELIGVSGAAPAIGPDKQPHGH
jgi:hypothetical protein